MEREVRTFPRRHVGFIPLPGSVEAGAGVLRKGGPRGVTIPVESVREIAVKEVKQLAATQDFIVRGAGREIRFRSFVDDSPLLLMYLWSKVPEVRWHIARSSSVFMAKLNALALVPVMAWCALMILSQDAGRIASHRALTARSEPAEATVLDVRATAPGRFLLTYSFEASRGGEFLGSALASGTPPAPGGRLAVRHDPNRPHYNRPEDGHGFDVPSPWTVLGPALVMLLVSLPHAAAILVFTVRPDPFAEWIREKSSTRPSAA